MFAHIFVNRFKCIVRDKQMMFWTAMFPILLATLFYMAFSNLEAEEMFIKINIAVVDNAEYQRNEAFKSSIAAVSNSDETAGQNNLFNVKFTTKDEADDLLKNNKITGYIFLEDGVKLVVKKSGFNETIIKTFVEDFIETNSTILTIVSQSRELDHNRLIANIGDRQDFIKEVSVTKAKPDNTLNYFYTLIAMACLIAYSIFDINHHHT